MSTNSKIVLAVVCGVLIVCACVATTAVWLFRPISTALEQTQGLVGNLQPAEVNRIAQRIADFQLPVGYTGQYAMEIGHFELAIYAADGYRGHLVLMQLPPGANADQAEMERRLREQTHDLSNAHYTRVRTISSNQTTIRGQSGTVTTSEGKNSQGETYALTYAIFQGKEGLAYLLIAAPLSQWDQAQADAFIASLR